MPLSSRCAWTLILIGNAGLLWRLARGADFGLAASFGLPAVVTAAAVFCLTRVSRHEDPPAGGAMRTGSTAPLPRRPESSVLEGNNRA